MTVEEYEKLLDLAELKKIDFAKEVGRHYQTVRGWGHPKPIPFWVESWLKNFIKIKENLKLADSIKDIIKIGITSAFKEAFEGGCSTSEIQKQENETAQSNTVDETDPVEEVLKIDKSKCTAWVNFDGTTTPPTIRDSYNVKDVIKTGTGKFEVFFKTEMNSDIFAVGGTRQYSDTNYHRQEIAF